MVPMTTTPLVNLAALIDDAKCFELVRQHRWPDGVRCPTCGSAAVARHGRDDTQPHRQRYRCSACGSRFDDLTGTALAGHHRPPPARVAARAAERRRQRLALHQQAWALFRQGWSGDAVARELGIGRRTAYRWLKSETFPERQGRSDAGRSLLDPWGSYILERWNA